MSKRRFRYRTRKYRSLDATNAGPIVKLSLAAAAVVGFALLVGLVIVPYLTNWLQSDLPWPWSQPTPFLAPTPTPVLRPAAVHTPRPLTAEVVVADPAVTDGTLVFATGESAERCTKIKTLALESGTVEELAVVQTHDTLRYPRLNDGYLAYFDGDAEGGGVVRAIDRATGLEALAYDVRYGAPKLFLETKYLLFTERTGTSAFRLNLFDLSLGEAVTVALLSTPAYGASAPAIVSGQILYADRNPEGMGTSLIESLHLETGGAWTFDPGTYVHDPKSNGDCWAWMSGNHGADSDLYISLRGAKPVCVARGIVDFEMTRTAVVFCRDESVYAYVIEDDRTYVLSKTGTRAQLLCAGDGYAVWRDVTDPDRPATKFMKVE